MQETKKRYRMERVRERRHKEGKIVSMVAVRDAKEQEKKLVRQRTYSMKLYVPKKESELRAIDALSDRKGPELLDPEEWKTHK